MTKEKALEELKNTTTLSNQTQLPLTLKHLKELVAKMKDLPPSLIEMRCSKDTFNYIKIATGTQINGVIGNNLTYIKVVEDDLIKTGSVENIYSDKSRKLVKIF